MSSCGRAPLRIARLWGSGPDVETLGGAVGSFGSIVDRAQTSGERRATIGAAMAVPLLPSKGWGPIGVIGALRAMRGVVIRKDRQKRAPACASAVGVVSHRCPRDC